MALTLSVGFVVDDAIVMLENIVRHMEMGKTPMRGGARRLEGDRLHDPLDDDLARGGVHPGPVHGRHRRPAASRVRGHDRRRDPRLGLRVAQPDADAVQPLPEAARTTQKHGRFYKATERMLRRVARACTTRTLRSGAAAPRRRRWLVCRSSLLVATVLALRRRSRRASCRARTRARSSARREAAQGIGFDEMVRAPAGRSRRSSRKDPNVAGVHVVGRAARRQRGRQRGHHACELKPRGERKADGRRDHRGAAAEARASPGHPRVTCRTRRRSASAAARRKSLYQFTLQDTDTDELYQCAPHPRSRRCGRCPSSQDVSSDLQIKNPQVNVDDRPRPGLGARRLDRSQVENALYNAYGTRQVSTIYAPNNQYQVILELAPEFQHDPGGARRMLYVRSDERRRSSRSTRSRRSTHGRRARSTVSHTGPAAVGDDLVQPEAGRRARRRRRPRSSAVARETLPATITTSFQGTAQAFQDSLQGLGLILLDGDRRHLHRARHPLRELHPPAHDPLGAAVRRLRRAADAADLQDGAAASTRSSASSCSSAS